MPEIEEMDDELTPTETPKGKAKGKPGSSKVTPELAAAVEAALEAVDTKSPDPATISQPIRVDTKSYVVKHKIKILWQGRAIWLKPGDIVSDGSHGTNVYERFTNQGVALEPKV